MEYNDECHILVFLTIMVIGANIAANSLYLYIIMLTSGTTETQNKNPIIVCTRYIWASSRYSCTIVY